MAYKFLVAPNQSKLSYVILERSKSLTSKAQGWCRIKVFDLDLLENMRTLQRHINSSLVLYDGVCCQNCNKAYNIISRLFTYSVYYILMNRPCVTYTVLPL